jgi:elongation factor P
MDQKTYETVEIDQTRLEWEKNFIAEGVDIKIRKYGEEILDIMLPDLVTMTIKTTENAVQGNSVTNAGKKAWIDSGWEIEVPQFIKEGEKVVIDTRNGKYVSRGK